MAHATLIVATKNLDMDGNKLTQSAIEDLAQKLRQKYGDGSVKLQKNRLKINLKHVSCICGKRDCWGPEHEQWCPLWHDTEMEMKDEQT